MSFPMPLPFLGSSAATVSLASHAVQTGSAATFTFTSQSLGVAASNRKIVVGVVGDTSPVSSLTVAGNSASSVVAQNNGAGNEYSALWQLALAAGTTGTVVVNFTTTSGKCGIGIWAVYGALSAAFATNSSGAANPASATLNIPAGGVAIGCTILRSNTDRTFTWTNLTKDYDEVVATGGDTQTGASQAYATTQTGLTITCTPSGAGVRNPVMTLASWGPA